MLGSRTPSGQSSNRWQQQADCQAPTSSRDRRVWYSRDVEDLYSRSSVSMTVGCSVWGQKGTFRVFLATNLTHMAVVARSEVISVETNVEYELGSFFSSVYPCPPNDIKAITVKRPKCAPVSDKIRAYGQGKPVSGHHYRVPSNTTRGLHPIFTTCSLQLNHPKYSVSFNLKKPVMVRLHW